MDSEILQTILSYLTIIVTIASAISMVTPSPVDNAAVAFLKKVVDVLALNMAEAETKAHADQKIENKRRLRDAR